jgi:2,3-bisphosphoglycerate-dependent phosphoglycerate mutase
LRAFFQHFEGISDADLKKLAIPNALPIVYEFDEDMNYLTNYHLTDQESPELRSSLLDQGQNNIDWAM